MLANTLRVVMTLGFVMTWNASRNLTALRQSSVVGLKGPGICGAAINYRANAAPA